MDLLKITVFACFLISKAWADTSSDYEQVSTAAPGPVREKGGRCGTPGVPGIPGIPGNNGRNGQPGAPGAPGAAGPKGDQGDTTVITPKRNWKQCSWRHGDGKDNGVIKECTFVKQHDETHLRVFYGGNLRIYNCNRCCKRWYFTFNGAECKGPLPIDGIFYMWKGKNSQDIHRHRHIEGFCGNIPKGYVRVSFNVGNCNGYGNADAHSGWNSVSRIVIEEVSPPQR